MTGATTAVRPELSEAPCEPTPSRSPESSNELSESSILNVAPPNGLSVTEPGWLTEPDQREARRQAYDAGKKHGAAAFFNSPVMENIAFELKFLRKMHDAALVEMARLERLSEFWRLKFVDCVRVIRKPK
jgi:hypothetical protein